MNRGHGGFDLGVWGQGSTDRQGLERRHTVVACQDRCQETLFVDQPVGLSDWLDFCVCAEWTLLVGLAGLAVAIHVPFLVECAVQGSGATCVMVIGYDSRRGYNREPPGNR